MSRRFPCTSADTLRLASSMTTPVSTTSSISKTRTVIKTAIVVSVQTNGEVKTSFGAMVLCEVGGSNDEFDGTTTSNAPQRHCNGRVCMATEPETTRQYDRSAQEKRRSGPHRYSHHKVNESLEKAVNEAQKALRTEHIDNFFLQASSQTTRSCSSSTLRAISSLHRAGHFSLFGLSAFSATQVRRIVSLCKRHGFRQPEVYQGRYNAFERAVEGELLPCLREYGIAFYALGGGGLRGGGRSCQGNTARCCRHKTHGPQNGQSRRTEESCPYLRMLDSIIPAAKRLGISIQESMIRWSSQYGMLDTEYGDAIVVPARNTKQLEENLQYLDRRPLPEVLVEIFNEVGRIQVAHSGPDLDG